MLRKIYRQLYDEPELNQRELEVPDFTDPEDNDPKFEDHELNDTAPVADEPNFWISCR